MLRTVWLRSIVPVTLHKVQLSPVAVTAVVPSVLSPSTLSPFSLPKCVHTASNNLGLFGPPQEESLFKRVAKRLGWTETSRSTLHAYGYLLYIKVADDVQYLDFFKHCDMDDTFLSWFSVIELHIWMVAVRLMEEGEEGKIIRNAMVKAMWEDCDARSKKLEGALASARKKQINQISEEFQASLIAYDEGLLGNDKVLAGSLWRRFLKHKCNHEKINQEELLHYTIALEMLVIYVRSQYHNLHHLSRERLLRRKFSWSPFDNRLLELSDKLAVKKAAM